MLFTARSPAFETANPDQEGGLSSLVRTLGLPAHRPWLVLTYLLQQPLISSWETVCAGSSDDLLTHVKQLRGVAFAHLLYLAPPATPQGKWARHQIRLIEQGRSESMTVNVFSDERGRAFCFDRPDVDPEDVQQKRVLLRLRPYIDFN